MKKKTKDGDNTGEDMNGESNVAKEFNAILRDKKNNGRLLNW